MLTSLLVLVLVFVSGYVAGFNRAAGMQPAASENLNVPETEKKNESDYLPQDIDKKEPGADVDVDKVEKSSKKTPPANTAPQVIKPKASKPTAELKQQKNVVKPKLNTVKEKPSEKHVEKITAKTPDKSPKQMSQALVANAAEKPVEKSHVTKTEQALTPDNAQIKEEPVSLNVASMQPIANALPVPKNDYHYSIQVGMYGNLENAERMLDELINLNPDAHIEPTKNGNEETRYNVRIGKYTDRTSALNALEEYQNDQAGSGYIIRVQNQ